MAGESLGFERAASYYDATRGFPPGVAEAVAGRFAEAAGLVAASRVLEVGVGTGRIALPLSRRVRAYVGVDLARPMLDVLRTKRTDEPVAILQADATRLPFADASFDAALAIHVLHLVGELAHVVRPGAAILLNDRDHIEREPLVNEWNERREAYGIPYRGSAIGVESIDALAAAFADAGFTERGAGVGAEWSHGVTPTQFMRDLEDRVWSSTWRLPDEPYRAALADFRAWLVDTGIPLDVPLTTVRRFRYLLFRRGAA